MPIVKELKQSDTLVIAATGIRNYLNMSVSDFFGKSGMSGASRIVISDPTKRMTLGGLPPDYPSFFDYLDYLKQEILRISPNKLIVTGTSGGANTALLLGHLLKANYVVAFSPYPYLSIKELKRMQDPALQTMCRVVEKLDRLPDEIKKLFDLRKIISNWNGVTQYYVHVSRYHDLDYRRAMYLNNLPMLSITAHPYTTHAVVSLLSRHGKLKKCFEFPYKYKTSLVDIFLHLKNIIKAQH